MDQAAQRPGPSQGPRIIMSQNLPQRPSTKIEDLLNCLRDGSHRLSQKVTMLTNFYENLDEMINTQTYATYQGEIYELLIGDLKKTQPHFIAENETQQLRKAVIQLFLRLPISDLIKRISQKHNLIGELLNIVSFDNEENGVLALKTLNDQLKINRVNTQDLPDFFDNFKQFYVNFTRVAEERKEIFLARPVTEVSSIEDEVTKSLSRLYYTKTLLLRRPEDATSFQYTLIPKASMSVKVFSEIPPLLMQLYQVSRIPYDAMFVVMFNYFCVSVPRNVDDIALEVRGNGPLPALNAPLIDEFHNSQVRALYFMAWIIKQQRQVSVLNRDNAAKMTKAMIRLLESLNPHVTAARREFIAAVKILLLSECKGLFVGVVSALTCERYILGDSYASQDVLRNVIYSQLADVLHHIRFELPYSVLVHLFNLCVRCLHDTQLISHNQTMYGKLLMNLCDPLLKFEKDRMLPARETFLYAFEAFVKKTNVLADHTFPQTIQSEVAKRDASIQLNQRDHDQSTELGSSPRKQVQMPTQTNLAYVHWQEQATPLTPHECRNILRYTINPIKILSVALSNCHLTEDSTNFAAERELFYNFFVYGIKCLQQFILLVNQVAQNSQYAGQIKAFKKDEKECIEMFACIFSDGHPQVFQYIMSKNIGIFVEALIVCKPLQDIPTHFMNHARTCTIMGSVLLKYLLKQMKEIGPINDRSKVYLALFSLVFKIVSQDQSSNQESMLMPYLHEIIAEALQYAIRSRENWNYFQLLRGLFRSIGTGAHDQLYREFLPLLPSILQQLNRFQNGSHRQTIHDVFVELCLTVPVRLSSLLPYLALLMDPLVCALHGSTTLVQQGLRTLELCVDNLQPEYFFDHMETVRASLMQGLWRCLYTQDSAASTAALRIMAKLGGSSRRAFLDAQVYEFIDETDSALSLNSMKVAQTSMKGEDALKLRLNTMIEVGGTTMPVERGMKRKHEDENLVREVQPLTADISVGQVVESAVSMIKSSQVNEHQPPLSVNWAHWQSGFSSGVRNPKAYALEVCKTVIYTVIQKNPIHLLTKQQKRELCQKAFEKWIQTDQKATVYRCTDTRSRTVFGEALSGIFFGIVASEYREQTLPFFSAIIVHLTTQSILESMENRSEGMDGFILIDVITRVLSDSCKEFAYSGLIALSYIKLTVSYLFELSDLSKASKLIFFSELLEQIRLLCYKREWYAKLGGCTALRFFLENFPRDFVVSRASEIIDALFTTISGVADEVSSGAVDVASKCLDLFVTVCFSSLEYDESLLNTVISYIIGRFCDPEAFVRSESYRLLERVATLTDKNICQLLEDKHNVLKQLLLEGFTNFATMTSFAQIAFLEFISRFLIDGNLYDDTYIDQSVHFISNLQLIVANTDVALNAMPSCRYATSNMNRGSHSLEAQLKSVKEEALKTLEVHTKVLVKMRKSLRDGREVSQTEKLAVVLQAIDVEKMKKNGEDSLKELVKMAFELADLDLPDMELDDTNIDEQIEELKELLEHQRINNLSENEHKSLLLTSFLDDIVKFYLRLASHPTHPLQSEAKKILKKLFADEPVFSVYVRAELNHQLELIQPILTLNQSVGHSKKAAEKLNFLDASDKFKLFKSYDGIQAPAQGNGGRDQSKRRVNLCVDLDGEETVEALLKGDLLFKLKDQSGNTLALGKVLGYVPVAYRADNKNSGISVEEIESIAGVRRLKDDSQEMLEKMQPVNVEREDYEYVETEKVNELVKDIGDNDDIPEVKENELNQVTFVVADRTENAYTFKRYVGSLPPKINGTFVTFTRLPTGELVRSIKTYGQAKVDQRIDYFGESELERQFGHPACSMIFEEIDETTAAHLTEVANMLMLEAQSLGLDKPTYTVTLESVPNDGGNPEEMGQHGLQDIGMFDIDDQALQDIENTLFETPDDMLFNESNASPEKSNNEPSTSEQPSEPEKPSEDQLPEPSTSAEEPVQTDIDLKDGLDAGYIKQVEQNQHLADENLDESAGDKPLEDEIKKEPEEPMDTSEVVEEKATEKSKETTVEDILVLRTDKKWTRPVVCHFPIDKEHRANFEQGHVAMDETLKLNGEGAETIDDLSLGQHDDNPVAQHPSETFEPAFIGGETKKQKRIPGKKRVSLDEKMISDTEFEHLLDETERSDGLSGDEIGGEVVKRKKIKLIIDGAERIDIQSVELPEKLMENIAEEKVYIGTEGESGKASRMGKDLELGSEATGPYDYITDEKLKNFFNNLHKLSPKRASNALKYYTKKLTEAIRKEHVPTLPVDSDGVLRIQYASESVILPSKTIVQTMPRTIFNYLSNEIFDEMKDLDRLDKEVKQTIKNQALNKDLFDVDYNQPDSDDELEAVDLTEGFLTVKKLKTMSDLREMIDAKIPDNLMFYICGEVSTQVFSKNVHEVTEEDLSILYHGLELLLSADITVMEQLFAFLVNSISFLAGTKYHFNITDYKMLDETAAKLMQCLARIPKRSASLLLSYTVLIHRATGIFVNEMLMLDGAEALRSSILKNYKRIETLLYGETIEDESDEFLQYSPELKGKQRLSLDYVLFSMMYSIAQTSSEDFANSSELLTILVRFWRSDDMRRRYTVRDGYAPNVGDQILSNMLTVADSRKVHSASGDMIAVPELIIKTFVEFTNLHPQRIDVLYYSCFAFSHKFVTDFAFFKKHIDEYIIPLMDIEWRHKAFDKVIEFFKPKRTQFGVTESEILARFIQYVVTPSFVYAFNKFPVNDVVGCEPNPEEKNEKSIMWQFCLHVIEPYNKQFPVPDLLKITLYQFCALLVQKCPIHIHDNKKQKRQGECLRLFMLFGWPCLQAQHQGDQIEKYAGQYLIVNLMEEFSIAKKIVLQALTALVCAHQTELREVVKKSIEIIIPSMSNRMEDGDQQIVLVLKKCIEEPTTSQIVHCISIAARHYKVLFNMRCTVAKMMNSAVQRLISQNVNETKKVALDMCETCIKWEQHRQKMLETVRTNERNGVPIPRIFQQQRPMPDVTVENLKESFDQSVIDSIFNILLKLATSVEQSVSQTMDPNVRRALMLLRLAVKPHIFGESKFKLTLLEKPFADFASLQPDVQQQPPRISIVVGTLDVITTIIAGLSGDTLKMIVGRLEKHLANCLTYPYTPISQALIKFLTKFVEVTEITSYGAEQFEELNNALRRYINNNIVAIQNAPSLNGGSVISQITVTLALFRVFCKINSAYIDPYLGNFFKFFLRLTKDYSPVPSSQSDRPLEFIILSMELVRPRIATLEFESRRTLLQLLMHLTEKNLPERLMDKLVQIMTELIKYDKEVVPNYSVQLLSKLIPLLQKQYHNSSTTVLRFLNIVHSIFNDKDLRKSDGAQKLQTAFFWGLANSDESTRRSFFQLFESQFPRSLFERIMFILGEQNWIPMSNTFWINHCLNVIMKAVLPPANQKTTISLLNGRTFDSERRQFAGIELSDISVAEPEEEIKTEVMDTDANVSSVVNTLMWRNSPITPDAKVTPEQLMDFENQLLADPPTQPDDFLRSLMEMCYTDVRLCKKMFIDFFVSIWSQMPMDEMEKRSKVASFFLCSGVALTTADMPITPLNCFYEALIKCQSDIKLDAQMMEYLATTHKDWYNVLDRMESKFRKSQLARHMMNSTRLYHDDIRLMDALSSLYERLGEHDLLAAMWRKRACLNGTIEAIQFYHQGMYREARIQSRLAIKKGRELFSQDALTDPTQQQTVTSTAPFYDIRVVDIELRKLEEIWIQSCTEMGDWKTLLQYVNNPDVANTEVLADAAWHLGEWRLLRELSNQIEATGQKEQVAKALLYRTMCNITEFELNQNRKLLEYNPTEVSNTLIAEWRQLPSITSEVHMQVLRKAQLVQEITESATVGQTACEKMITVTTADSYNYNTNRIQFHVDNAMVNEIKQFIKTWRCRASYLSVDPLSHLSSTFAWRVQQYFNVMRIFDGADSSSVPHQGQMQPLHSIAQAQIMFARMYKKAELYEESMQQLAQLHAMTKIYRIDGCMRIIEEAKCFMGLAEKIGRVQKYQDRCVDENKVNVSYGLQSYERLLYGNEHTAFIEKALELVDSVNPALFPKELAASVFTLRAQILSTIGKITEADRTFSIAAQLAEDAPPLPASLNGKTVWKYWAVHLEQKFCRKLRDVTSESLTDDLFKEIRGIGVEALTSLMEMLRTVTETKVRRYMCRFFHVYRSIMALDAIVGEERLENMRNEASEDERLLLMPMDELLQNQATAIPVVMWLFWLEQIIKEVSERGSKGMAALLRRIADTYPQQTLVAIRTVLSPQLITQKIEDLQKRLPLISDWMKCAPPLDERDEKSFQSQDVKMNESEDEVVPEQDHPDHEYLARKRDESLKVTIRTLILLEKKVESEQDKEKKLKLEEIKTLVNQRICMLQYLQENNFVPRVENLKKEREFRLETSVEREFEVLSLENSDGEGEDEGFVKIKVPRKKSTESMDILIDTRNLAKDDYDIEITFGRQKDGLKATELELKENETRKEEEAMPLLLSVIDTVCIDRYADIKALNQILNELDNFPETWAEQVYKRLVDLVHLLNVELRQKEELELVSDELQAALKTLYDRLLEIKPLNVELSPVEVEIEGKIAVECRKMKENEAKPTLQLMKQWLAEFLMPLEEYLKGLEGMVFLADLSPFLSRFNGKSAQVDVPSMWISTRNCLHSAQIAYFLPTCQRIFRGTGIAYIFSVLSQNGKVFSYLLQREEANKFNNRWNQMIIMLNAEIQKNREMSRRQLHLPTAFKFQTGPRKVITEMYPLSSAASFPQTEIDRSTNSLLSLTSLAQRTLYRSWPQISLWSDHNPAVMETEFSDWMREHYPDTATFWTVRKKLSQQWGLLMALELAFGLKEVDFDSTFVGMFTAQLFVTKSEMKIKFENGKFSLDLATNSLRLSPNISEFFQTYHLNEAVFLSGHLTGAFVSTCRFLAASKTVPLILRALLWDQLEELSGDQWQKPEVQLEAMDFCNRTVAEIVDRISGLAQFKTGQFKALEPVIEAAKGRNQTPDYCPWF
ncbi:unnamed protein product [Bursaphelenchus okinawaensis]|uniref:PIK-related kinase FAT domain-containing protein n=1 Tax=Bursaphelenchus okinawaensis TaxID=465554 RepID=A0A811KAW7_9BILA|nr:unnamed protein product [Bursaphelenchus okinawaensis]CAG9095781.1 unnamed protein product [Bursaphelenchus okinawaensis]